MTKRETIGLFLFSAACLGSTAHAQGIFTLGQAWINGCQPGFACNKFTVTALDIPSVGGQIAVRRSMTGANGTILFLSGEHGTGWAIRSDAANYAFIDQLIALNYDIVQVLWRPGWIDSPPGVAIGQIQLAKRPATAITWIKNNVARGREFIVTGNSNGSTQIAYSLAFYGAGDIIQRAILTSGPPYMAIDKGCGGTSSGYTYPNNARSYIDCSYGFPVNGTGPCWNRNPSWFVFERVNSVDTGGIYNYPNTNVKIMVGILDMSFIKNRGRDYYNKLIEGGHERISYRAVSGVGHGFNVNQAGLDSLLDAILH
jgi:hypothetical protein